GVMRGLGAGSRKHPRIENYFFAGSSVVSLAPVNGLNSKLPGNFSPVAVSYFGGKKLPSGRRQGYFLSPNCTANFPVAVGASSRLPSAPFPLKQNISIDFPISP